jgi:hypothetical protein
MAFMSGPFDVRYDVEPVSTNPTYSESNYAAAKTIGTIGSEGVRLSVITEGEEIVGDNLAASVQDGVYQGGNVFLDFVAEEIQTTQLLRLIWAFNNANVTSDGSITEGKIGSVGRLWSSYAGSMLLRPYATSAQLTPYAGITLESLWMPRVVLVNGHEVQQKLHAGLDTIPIRLRVLPYMPSGGTNIYSDGYWYARVEGPAS